MFQTPPQRTSARELLTTQKLSIPVYQRGYAWGDEEIDEFVLDISNLWKKDRRPEEHFLGTMLTYHRAEDEWLNVLEIIDGQQRITTISLLILAVRESAKRLLDSELLQPELARVALRIAQSADECLHMKRADGERVPRLSLNEQDDAEWRRLVKEGTPASRVTRRTLARSSVRINEAFDSLSRLLSEHTRMDSPDAATKSVAWLEERFARSLDCLHVVRLTAKDEKDVYDLFMIINDRGRPLSNVDLLRTSTLQRLKGRQRDFRRAKTAFGLLVDAEESAANRALAHYINSFTGARMPKSKVLPETRALLFGAPEAPVSHDELLDRLEDLEAGTRFLLRFYDSPVDWYGEAYPFPTPNVGADRQFRLLSVLKSESCKPLLVAARGGIDAERYKALLGILERIVFRVVITNGVHKSLLADFFIDQAARLRVDPGSWNPVSVWSDALADSAADGRITLNLPKHCSDAKFKVGLSELDYRKQKGYIAFLLHGLETFDHRAQRPSDEVTFNFKQLHLDHIVPQSDEENPVVREGLAHSPGNLVLISGPKNQSLGGQPYGPEKARAYCQSKIRMTRDIGANSHTWTPSDVRARTDDMCTEACKVWSFSAKVW